MDEKKKQFRVMGVERADIHTYAENIAKCMNELSAEGYDIQLIEQSDGALLVGHLATSTRPTPLALLQDLVNGPEADEPPGSALSARSVAILRAFARMLPSSDAATITREAPKHAARACHGFSASELATAAEEFLREADEHDKTHRKNGEDADCVMSAMLRALAPILKDTARSTLQ